MLTKEVLLQTCVLLGKDDIEKCPYFSGEETDLSELEQSELNMMLKCLNFIIDELSVEYLPLYKEKEVQFDGGKFCVQDIDDELYQIVKIQNKFGQNVKFKIVGDYIEADTTATVIKYIVFAKKAELDGSVESFNGLLSSRVLAYGVAMEYCFINSLYDDALIWESRYKNSLINICRKQKNIVMPKRRWI